MTYKKRLLIDLDGNDSTIFSSANREVIGTGYVRVVIGKRGPYIEFSKDQINFDVIFIPDEQQYRLASKVVYYNEWRSKRDNVKLYEQKKTVQYADYRVGLWYVSPFDLRTNGEIIIKPLRRNRQQDLFDLQTGMTADERNYLG